MTNRDVNKLLTENKSRAMEPLVGNEERKIINNDI